MNTQIPAEEFWVGNYYNHPEISIHEINKYEIESGYRLPELYKRLLLIQNGGEPRRNKFLTEVQNKWADDHTPFDSMCGIIYDKGIQTPHNLLDNDYMVNEWGYPDHVLLISSDGHNSTVLDYRLGKNPCVSWIDVDVGHDAVLAKSFEDFFQGLR